MSDDQNKNDLFNDGDPVPDWIKMVDESPAPAPKKAKGRRGQETVPEPDPEPVLDEPTAAADLYDANEGSAVAPVVAVEEATPDTVDLGWVDVRCIRAADSVVLVEWIDGAGLHRAELAESAIAHLGNGQARVGADILAQAAPYGLPWESLVKLTATPEAVAVELRRMGVWSVEDMRRQPDAVQRAIMAAHRADINSLSRAVDNHLAEVGNE